jgi:hypothetical protein
MFVFVALLLMNVMLVSVMVNLMAVVLSLGIITTPVLYCCDIMRKIAWQKALWASPK